MNSRMAATNTNKVIIKGMVITSTELSSGLLSFSSSVKKNDPLVFLTSCTQYMYMQCVIPK